MSALCLGRPLLHQPLSATVAQTVLCRFEKAELVSAFFAERHNIHLRKAKMRIVSDDHRDNPEEDVAQPVLTLSHNLGRHFIVCPLNKPSCVIKPEISHVRAPLLNARKCFLKEQKKA